MTCDNVVWSAKFNDPITKTGLSFAAPNNIKVAGTQSPRKRMFPLCARANSRPTPAVTPDVGDTDSCSGTLTTNSNPWGDGRCLRTVQPGPGDLAHADQRSGQDLRASTGRGDCDPGTTDRIEVGRCTWANCRSRSATRPRSDRFPPRRVFDDARASKVRIPGLRYLRRRQRPWRPAPTSSSIRTPQTPVKPSPISWTTPASLPRARARPPFFDQTTTSRAGRISNLLRGRGLCLQRRHHRGLDRRCCSPAGGLQQVVTDTDVDTDVFGASVVGTNPAYNNSIIFSI